METEAAIKPQEHTPQASQAYAARMRTTLAIVIVCTDMDTIFVFKFADVIKMWDLLKWATRSHKNPHTE